MENDRLKIWLNFWKFFFGSVVVTLVSIVLNHQIQKSNLDLDAQRVEDTYVQEHLTYYMETGYEQRIDLVNFLRYLTINEERKENYDSLYVFLNGEMEEKELELKLEADSILELKNLLDSQFDILDEKEKELADLNDKFKNSNPSNRVELGNLLEQKKNALDSLENKTFEEQNKIVAKEFLTRKIQKDINNPVDDGFARNSNYELIKPLEFDLGKGNNLFVDSLEVKFTAQKVSTNRNRALIKIQTGEPNNNPIYYLGVNKFCVFQKAGVKYKLLNVQVFKQDGEGISIVKLKLTQFKSGD